MVGMAARRIDHKYSIHTIGDEAQIVNMQGVAVPEDEPLILFRARDRLALATLQYYRDLAVADGCTQFHLDGIDNRIGAFGNFAREHPELMKQPGVTQGK